MILKNLNLWINIFQISSMMKQSSLWYIKEYLPMFTIWCRSGYNFRTTLSFKYQDILAGFLAADSQLVWHGNDSILYVHFQMCITSDEVLHFIVIRWSMCYSVFSSYKITQGNQVTEKFFSAKFWLFESMVSWLLSFRACDKQHCHRKAVLQQMLLISWQAISKMGTEGLEPLYLFKVCLQFPNILPTRTTDKNFQSLWAACW